jgi:hypothetical protein
LGIFGPLSFGDIMAIIVVVAAVGTYQFFRGRKLNLMLMYFTMKEAEKVLKPSDKNYTLLGTYVGYTAIYDLTGPIRKAEITVTLLPRQSLFYFPISLLTSRFDKAFIRFIFPQKVKKEAHIISRHYYRLGMSREVRGFQDMVKEDLEINGKKYVLAYFSGSAARKLERFMKSLERPDIVKHVALVPQNRSLYIAIKLDPRAFADVISKGLRLAEEFAGQGSSA